MTSLDLSELTKEERISYINECARLQEETRKNTQRVSSAQAQSLLNATTATVNSYCDRLLGGRRILTLSDIEYILKNI